jgi:class 3 adenylate cyclase
MQATWRFRFPVSRERLWPFVSDTDRINARAGLPPVTYRVESEPGGAPRTIATMKRGPLRISWEEPPFTWEVPRRLSITRRFLNGPFAVFSTSVQLLEDGDGTVLEHHVELEPRNPLGRWLAPLVLAAGERGARRAYEDAAARAQSNGDAAPSARILKEESALEERFMQTLRRERLLDGKAEGFRDLVRELAAFLEVDDERDFSRLKPYALADRWKADRRAVLALLLTLTRGGCLDLSWDVICPSCRRPNGFESLQELKAGVHCDMCNITFGPEFDRNVEVTFSAAPLGKGVDVPVFCAVGPHKNRQVYAQMLLDPGACATLDVTLTAGHYAFEVPPDRAISFDVEAGGAASLRADVEAQAIRLSAERVAPGYLAIEARNALERGILVKVTDSELPADVATAADVTALQEFRDLFSSEVLAGGLELAIRSLTVVFSDLVGSTHLYSSSGDAPAFRIVQEHFEGLRNLVAEHRGAIVKTIGDAVMAVFVDPADALTAALRFAATVGIVQGPTGPLEIRVGMHAGPCIAMRANEKLDYFGTTVNLAARIGHIATAGEVALSRSTAELPPVARVIGSRGVRIEPIGFKGFAAPIEVVRIDADPP